MKKKVVMIVLSMMVAATMLTGCKNTETKSLEKTETTNEAEVASTIDLITDWDNKANIILSKKIEIDGSGATNQDGVITISEGGAYTISGEAENVSFLVNTDDDVKLILAGVTITNEQGPVIYGNQSKSLYIELKDGSENSLTDGAIYEQDSEGKNIGKATISSNDDLVFLGTGALNVIGNFKHGIAGDDSVYFVGGTYTISAKVTDGIHGNDLVCIDGGNFDINANSDCIQSEADLAIHGGSIVANSADEGIESKNEMTITGGSIAVTAADDGLNATSKIIIDGGDINIHTTKGDAVDSNGSIEINGGSLVAYGGGAPEGALDCDNAEIVINGGTVFAMGDANSPISEDSKQISVMLGQYNKGDEIAVVNSDGDEIYRTTLEDGKSNMVLSLPDLKNGEAYALVVNGEEDKTFTVESTVVSAGGSASQMGGPGMGGKDGQMQGQDGQMPEMNGERPEMPQDGQMPEMNGERPEMPQDGQMPEMDGERPEMPQGL